MNVMNTTWWNGVITGISFSLVVWAVARTIVIKRYMRKRRELIQQLTVPSNPFVNPAGEQMTKEMFEEMRNSKFIVTQVEPQEKKDKT